jgi:integrase
MSVYKRGDIYWVEFQINGRQIRRSAGTISKREAQACERRMREQAASDAKAIELGIPLKRTFGQALEKWLTSGAPKSMYSHIRMVADHLEPVLLSRTVPAAAEMKQAMLAAKLSPQTINRRLAVVRRVLNLAYKEWDWLREPLGQKIQMLSESGFERHVYLSRDEVTRLVKAMKRALAQRISLLAAYTGLRRGELLKLQPSNWRSPDIVLTANTKSGKPRTVPLIAELHPLMDELPFQITEWHLREDFEHARAQEGLEHVRFHDLRHTFASWIIEDPKNSMKVLSELLGHSSIIVTNRYAHLRTGALADAIASLESPQKSAQSNRRKKLGERK